ncbi:unnamed protein product [Microthlaspi erraticum]|uniref:Uncharacterized protein n=1 Tax=Microthlaspi erraticum TaxID=1685480 RepID=A0A6D2JU37_9BRAS|nr:unnamed protein product [Microthlaspi erraticum]
MPLDLRILADFVRYDKLHVAGFCFEKLTLAARCSGMVAMKTEAPTPSFGSVSPFLQEQIVLLTGNWNRLCPWSLLRCFQEVENLVVRVDCVISDGSSSLASDKPRSAAAGPFSAIFRLSSSARSGRLALLDRLLHLRPLSLLVEAETTERWNKAASLRKASALFALFVYFASVFEFLAETNCCS